MTATTILPTDISTDRTTAYADAVLSGKIVAGPHVRNACRRHLKDLADGHERGLSFDLDAAEKAFGFFEEVLRLSEGQFEGRPFELQPSQAFIVGSLFGWKLENGRRRFRRAYVEQGKGNGKSPLAGGIGLMGLCADGEPGAQVYAAAAKKEQAQILFADAVKMVRAAPALLGRLDFSGGPGREYNIAHHKSGSFFRPVSRDTGRTGSGPRPYFVLADEIHELPDRSILEMLERGFKFRRQPLLLMITNSGSDRTSVCWEEHEHAIKVAAGNYDAVTDASFIGEPIDDTTFSYVCALDDDDDPVNDPSCWIKANPLLGVTIEETYLADVVGQARAIPGKLNGILRLHFCVWTDAETAWMTRATLEPLLADFEPVEVRSFGLVST
jgi:phage terminase large subunit-like protein